MTAPVAAGGNVVAKRVRTRTIVLTDRMHSLLLEVIAWGLEDCPKGTAVDVRKLRNIVRSAKITIHGART